MLHFRAQLRQISADDPAEARFIEQHQGNLAVPPQGRKNDRTLGRRIIDRHGLSSPSRGIAGTQIGRDPRSTPWKVSSGSPMVMPLVLILYSRMVDSWLPVRFLMIEMARRTLPRASKQRKQNDRIGQVSDVDRGLHVTDQAMLGDRHEGRRAFAVEVQQQFVHVQHQGVLPASPLDSR